jgi:hypothetical protein
MSWGTLAAAALGAVFGVGTTLLADLVRSRRDLEQRWVDTKRLVYVSFLVALAQAHSRMVVAAFGGLPAPDRRQAVHQAFHSDPRHSEAKSVLRELAITAPDHVYRAAVPVYEQLRMVRDALAVQPITVDSDEYNDLTGPFFAQLESLQQVMRDDLQPTRRRLGRRAGRAPERNPVDVVLPETHPM